MTQKALESRIEDAVKLGDSDRVAIAKTELASFLNKKGQACVVRARLKRMRNFAVPLIGTLHVSHHWMENCDNGQGHCREFYDYFRELFTREPSLGVSQFNNYLVDFPRIKETDMAG